MERKAYTSLLALVSIIFALLFVWLNVATRKGVTPHVLSATSGNP